MIEKLVSRAGLLIQQRRYLEAEKVLNEALSSDPTNTNLLTMSSEVAMENGDAVKALDLIDRAISAEPDSDFLYYVKSRILYSDNKYSEADRMVKEAVDLNPSEPNYFGVWASIKLSRKNYKEALKLSDQALELDAENLLALNTRSTALLKLNRKEESFETIEDALEEDPNNSFTHSNYGWSLLEKGNTTKALEHFTEALRHDPNNRFAQGGMQEALKARYGLYRLFLKYSFWMSNMGSKYQWGVIIGFYILFKFLQNVSAQNPKLSVFITPIVVLMVVIAFSTWVMNPIGNLLLRINKYGKHLLDKEEKISSNLVGISLVLCLLAVLIYAITLDSLWLPVAAFGFVMMVPFSVIFTRARYKNAFLLYAMAMVSIGLLSIYTTFATGNLFNGFSTIFLLGFVAFQWGANFLMIRSSEEE